VAFVERAINVTFKLGQGQFGGSGADTVTLSGLRVSSKIIKAGGPSMGTAQLQVYGMTLSQMNKLSTLGMQITLQRKNTLLVEAGDADVGMATVFVGTIYNAWVDMQGAPEVPFHVEAHVGLFEAIAPAKPSSFTGSADVATIMSGLATQMGLKFENNGVSIKLANPYFWGSARDQAMACAEAAGLRSSWIIDNGTLAIWNPGQPRGQQVPLISADTGMELSPTYTSKGIMVKTLFNPSIGYGSKIKVESSLTPANGEWVVYSLDHDLDAKFPGGQWHSTIGAARPGSVVVA